jgi:hypothetical protein
MSTNSSASDASARPVADRIALAIQSLRVAAPHRFDALVRIDNRAVEADARFQFDIRHGMLHRRGCHAIPPNVPLLGLASTGPEYLIAACKRCKPVPEPPPDTRSTDRANVMFGLVSLVDQFAGVLRERGKDYRQTPDGQRLGTQLKEIYSGLGAREKEIVDVVINTLDQVAARLRSMDSDLKNPTPNGGE